MRSSCEVHGKVTGRGGKAVSAAQIVVWRQLMRKRLSLARGRTTEAGEYRLKFRAPEHAPGKLLIVVQARWRGLSAPLFSSPTSAQPSTQIDLSTEPLDRSEFTILIRAIHPLLDRLTLLDVVENPQHRDISFLAQETGKSTEEIMRAIVAARLEAAFAVTAAAFYAFLRQRVPSALPSPLLDASDNFNLVDALVQNIGSLIFKLSADTQKRALTAAVALDLIGPEFTPRIPEIVSQLQALRTKNLLNQPYFVGNATLGQLLDVPELPSIKKQAFAQALATNTQTMRGFWRTLGDGNHGFTEAEASLIERALSIGSFVKNHIPLIETLVRGFVEGTYKSLADLARLSVQDWVRLINEVGPPPGIDPAGTANSVEVFASVVHTRITRAYPTAGLANRIVADKLVPRNQQQPLARFFLNSPDLELIKHNIPAYLASQGARAFAGINPSDQPAVIANARRFQRVLRIAPNIDATQILLKIGLHSATQIATIGEQQFFVRATAAGITKPEANQIFKAAAVRYASVVSTYMKFNLDAMGVWPLAMGRLSDLEPPIQQAIQRDQSLATLFGTQDYCAVDDCTSVLSPAAYLCDLLLWLRNHPQGAGTALDVLDNRRPDIRHLLLNCPNSDIELPYIDLVNELLADKISPPTSTTLAAPVTSTQTSITVASAVGFPAPNFTVLIGAEILLVTAVSGVGNTTWAVSRGQKGTTAAAASAGDSVVITTPENPPWKQTSENLSPAQLNAAPEYFNQGAYITLSGASYPQNLPYSAGVDELRTYLGQWKLPLWQLRQTLLPLAGATLAQHVAAAGERFGLTAHGVDLLVNPNFVAASVAWNISNPAIALVTVPAFLQAASLSYESLLELLDVSWVQGGLNLTLQGINDLCDTSSQTLTPATTLAAPITAIQTSITVANAVGFPAPNFFVSIGAEVLQVTAVGGAGNTTWTVVRGQQGTVSAAAASGTAVIVVPLDAGFLDRAHRFLRLRLATGYKMWELDLLMGAAAIGNGTLDQSALVACSSFRQLQDVTGLALDRQLAFFENIDTATHRDPDGSMTTPLYSQIFLNPAVTSVAPDADLEAIAQGGAPIHPLLSDHLPAIQAALGTSAADSMTLFALSDNQLNLGNLSLTFRVNALATASKYSISDLLTIVGLLSPVAAAPATTLAAPITNAQSTITVTNAGPFAPRNFYIEIGAEILLVTAMSGNGNTNWAVLRGQLGTTAAAAPNGTAVTSDSASPMPALASFFNSPAAVLGLLRQVAALQKQRGLTLDAIKYLLTAPSAITGGWGTTSQMTEANIATTLGSVQQAVSSLLAASTTLTASITATQTSITVASSSGFPAPNFFINIGSEVLQVTAVGGSGNTTWTVARGQQGTTAAAATSGTAVTPNGSDVAGSAIAAVAANAHPAGAAGLANDVTALILDTLQLPGSLQKLLTVLTDPAFTGSTNAITPTNFPNQFLAIQLVDKVGVLVRGLRLVATDLNWLLANAAVYGGLDLSQLPVTTTQPALNLGPLLTTLLVINLARLWTEASPSSSVQTLYDVITGVSSGSADLATTQAALAAVTGWALPDIMAFAAALNLGFPADYTKPASYDALRTLEAMASIASATGAQLVSWGGVPANEAAAESLAADALGALKAQQPGNDAWLALAPTLMNPVRERRSAALQAYLIAQRDGTGKLIYSDTDGLFDYFLIDTQMTSCEVTSRIVQAYIAVQIFVERCLMNLEAPNVIVNLAVDNTWDQWKWMKRYRIWEANREVFLYPENWLIESQRPNRTEIYRKFEQDVRQGESTRDYLETVALNYIDRLDGLAHLRVTGTCEDSAGNIYVVARTLEDPPVFYLRSFVNGSWGGWAQIPLDIKAHQAIPAIYRGRVCLFWLDVKVSNEPQQQLPAAQQSNTPPSQDADRYVKLGVFFSIFRNGSWAPGQTSKAKLFDKPFYDPSFASDTKSVEALYTLKVHSPLPTPGYGARLYIDIFRRGDFQVWNWAWLGAPNFNLITGADETVATHLGRAVFDGRFSDLELRDEQVPAGNSDLLQGQVQTLPQGYDFAVPLLRHAQATYGPDAQPLLPLPESDVDPNIPSEPGLVPQAGALETGNSDPTQGPNQSIALNFTSVGALEQNVGALLNTAQIPFRVVGPATDLSFDPASYFFFQDNRRCYYVESLKYYWTGSVWTPAAPSDPSSVPFQVRFVFHPFYHAFTRLLWNQLAGGGFDLLYDVNLQQNPDQIDPSGADVFSFQANYQPVLSRVNWDHDDVTGQDRQFLDFRYNATFSVYNWELFYHIPLFIGQLLSQNQKFEDAQIWFHYIFNPTRQGSDPVPQRFWIPKPLHNLTNAQVIAQQINNLLVAVNQGDPVAVAEVENWRHNPFNPFLLADLRQGVPYMKSTVMSYLDNLIAWGDHLFATESREALSEATLIYVIASEILGPTPAAVTPPAHADESFEQLETKLDAFANAMVEIENVIGGAGGGGSGGTGGGIPVAQTFYFKIPPNKTLLNYWSTVADRLFKLRHCQNIAGAPLQLALFDAPIDPGLLIAAQAAGVDLSSVLSDISAPVPKYRFTALYPQALDFVNAVRAYGASLQAALEKRDAGALALLQQTTQQQLLSDGGQILDLQIQQAESQIQSLNHALELAQSRFDFNSSQAFMNEDENTASNIGITINALNYTAAGIEFMAAILNVIPDFVVGASGFGATPVATAKEGGSKTSNSAIMTAAGAKTLLTALDNTAKLVATQGGYHRRKDVWNQNANEARIQIAQTKAQLDAANFALQVGQQNKILHQEQIDNLQQQIDFLNSKFTNDDLYNWMSNQLSETYFQSYQLAFQICKQVERCYQFELGIEITSFIQFGYWDSLYKGLLSGETLNHDLRRMQASYLQQNSRRYELSRYISLGLLNPAALQQLLLNGKCDFDFPESLFDNDYPGHINRRVTRMSVTVVYPNPGKFDNVKATLTLVSNKVRIKTDTSSGYPEQPVGSDPRFIYNYAANSQKIALGNAQDDPGTFITAIASNIVDQRYLPFENAGVISSWHLEMPQISNEVDLSTVGDVILHIYYTALDGGSAFENAVLAYNAANLPTSGIKLFSAQNDFPAPAPTVANPYPVTPWQAFLATVAAPVNQTLTLNISPSKFPAWTRGKTISVTSLTVLAIAWPPGNFVLAPQAPLPTAQVNMLPVAGVTEPNVCAATIGMPPNTPLGTWSFELQQQGAADFRSLTRNAIGDVLLLVSYQAT